VFLDLREAGETCSKHRVTRLMRVNKIRAVRGYRNETPCTFEALRACPKRSAVQLRCLQAQPRLGCRHYVHPNMGRLASSLLLSGISRKIVGWSTKPTLGSEFALHAILMAARQRRRKRTIIH
jgi:putative transposase